MTPKTHTVDGEYHFNGLPHESYNNWTVMDNQAPAELEAPSGLDSAAAQSFVASLINSIGGAEVEMMMRAMRVARERRGVAT